MNQKPKAVVMWAAMAMLALLAGIAILAAFGHEPPAMVLAWEMTLFTAIGLIAGFLWRMPRLPWWAGSRPVVGTALIFLGVGAVYVPAQFIVSSLLLGAGARLMWLALSEPSDAGGELARREGQAPGTSVQRPALQRHAGGELRCADTAFPVPDGTACVPR